MEFSAKIKAELTTLKVMMTGGFRTLEGMNAALESDQVDIIGLGRPFCADNIQDLKKLIGNVSLNRRLEAPATDVFGNETFLRSFNSGIQAVWYSRQFPLIAAKKSPNFSLSKLWCILLIIPKYFYHPKKYPLSVNLALLLGILLFLKRFIF
jgi:hypothetical protein